MEKNHIEPHTHTHTHTHTNTTHAHKQASTTAYNLMTQIPNYNLIFFHKGNFHYPSAKRTNERREGGREMYISCAGNNRLLGATEYTFQ
jgi:hypothetical protein